MDVKFTITASKYVENILFKDGEEYYLQLFDLHFAQDCVTRVFTLSTGGGYRVVDLLSGKELEEKHGVYCGAFEKYRWYILKKS